MDDKTKKYRKGTNIGYVSIYDFDIEKAESEQKIIRFDKADKDGWILFLQTAKDNVKNNWYFLWFRWLPNIVLTPQQNVI